MRFFYQRMRIVLVCRNCSGSPWAGAVNREAEVNQNGEVGARELEPKAELVRCFTDANLLFTFVGNRYGLG